MQGSFIVNRHSSTFTSAIVALATLLTSTASVSAHANFQNSIPATGATVSAAPATLAITFSEELSAVQIAVTGPHASEVTTEQATIDLEHRTNVSVPLRDDGAGQYTVVWHNV